MENKLFAEKRQDWNSAVVQSKPKTLLEVTQQYYRSTRKQKSKILDSYCSETGHHRKHAIRMFGNFGRKQKKRGRKFFYDREKVVALIQQFRELSSRRSSKYLKASMQNLIEVYEQQHGPIAKETRELLLQISPATIDRVIRGERI